MKFATRVFNEDERTQANDIATRDQYKDDQIDSNEISARYCNESEQTNTIELQIETLIKVKTATIHYGKRTYFDLFMFCIFKAHYFICLPAGVFQADKSPN